MPSSSDYTERFNTSLSNAQEAKFQQWLRANGRQGDLADYDLRGAWVSGVAQDPRGHLPDTFKKPNHPTFSTESQYHGKEAKGGEWAKDGDKWVFKASPFNMQMTGEEELRRYFQQVEPDSTLVLPAGGAQ